MSMFIIDYKACKQFWSSYAIWGVKLLFFTLDAAQFSPVTLQRNQGQLGPPTG